MSSEANLSRIKTTTLFLYLYYVDWDVNYTMAVNNGVVSPGGGSGAQIIDRGLWSESMDNPVVTGRDANESVCVKFL